MINEVDMNMIFKRELFNPQEVKDMYPISQEAALAKKENDRQIRDVLRGVSDKLILVIGPCSADREDAVLDYIGRLRPVQERSRTRSSSSPASIPTNPVRPAPATKACSISPIP